jgi:hypothetical protein
LHTHLLCVRLISLSHSASDSARRLHLVQNLPFDFSYTQNGPKIHVGTRTTRSPTRPGEQLLFFSYMVFISFHKYRCALWTPRPLDSCHSILNFDFDSITRTWTRLVGWQRARVATQWAGGWISFYRTQYPRVPAPVCSGF